MNTMHIFRIIILFSGQETMLQIIDPGFSVYRIQRKTEKFKYKDLKIQQSYFINFICKLALAS